MNPYRSAMRDIRRRETHDLQDYTDVLLSDSGELEVGNYYRDDILMQLGGDILKLTKFEIPGVKNEDVSAQHTYLLRNLTPRAGQHAAIAFDDARHEEGPTVFEEHGMTVYSGGTILVGRRATPELRFSREVDDVHMRIRFGNLWRRLHFMDFDSRNGTKIHLTENGAHSIYEPTKHFVLPDGRGRAAVLRTEYEQRWLR